MTPAAFQKKIIKYIDSNNGVNATARKLNVSPAFISKVYNGHKPASQSMLDDMGFTKKVLTIYEEVKS